MSNTEEQEALEAVRELEKILKEGYMLRAQVVDGYIFIFGRHMAGKLPAVSCQSKDLVKCIMGLRNGKTDEQL